MNLIINSKNFKNYKKILTNINYQIRLILKFYSKKDI